jgi:PAS domain S-box-containing protein
METADPQVIRHATGLEQELRLVLDAMPVAVGHCDAEQRYVFVNRAYAARLGLTLDQIIGRPLIEVLGAELAERIRPYTERVLAGEAVQYESEAYYAAIGWRHVHCSCTPEWDAEGRVVGWLGTITDITDRHRSEQELRQREERLLTLTNALPQLMWINGPDGDIRHYNDRWFAYTGMDPQQPLGLRWMEHVHPEDVPAILEARSRGIAAGEPYGFEYRLRRFSGEYRWHICRVVPVRDAAGAIEAWIGTATDIHDLKEAEQALEHYRLLAQNARDIVLFIRLDGSLLEANDAAVAAYGYSRAELLTRKIFDLRDPSTAPWTPDQMAEADREGITFETFHRRRDGSLFPVEVSSRGMDFAGERLLLSIIRDITDRKRAEEALREADRRKDEFLATLAHELRNPLAPIRNAVQILRMNEAPEPSLMVASNIIDRQVQGLTRLVDDLLDVSRITRGRIELRRERTELSVIMERALETSRPAIEAAHHRLTVTSQAEPLWVEADVTRMAQALSNLLNNAAKYTRPGGHIQLSVERDGGQAVIRVGDDGIGIPREMLSRIFEMFAQVDTSLERTQGGLGIGLTIAQRLVEMHGGVLEAASDGPGRGSELTVRLPLPPETAPAEDGEAEDGEPASSSQAPGTLRVLVVDDNNDSADSLAIWLELAGHSVRTAYDGPHALAAAQEFRPEVVLLDIGMPGMSGYEVARRLREAPGTRDVRLLAMTGWGQDEDRRRSREAGFDGHLVKPLDPESLKDLFAQIAARRSAREPLRRDIIEP